MNGKSVNAIGLMSGTSLDGLDIVYVKFVIDEDYRFEILSKETVQYSSDWKLKLQNAIHLNMKNLDLLDSDYGVYLGEKVNEFILKHSIENIDFIASHGHTIFHEPHKGITKQIGSGEELCKITQNKVVCDFRTQDVKLGGQGAPLVPIGDQLLFAEYDACINLGGFSNISMDHEDQRIAYDICPVNSVLNFYSVKLGFAYDESGNLARSGKIDFDVLKELNSLTYYFDSYPKSLGIEWVHENIFPILSKIRSIEDVMRTFVEHCAVQISDSIKKSNSALFTGGGVFNTFLMERINALSETRIVIPERSIIEFKEALIFAFLGLRRLDDQVNCLASVTGAKHDHSSGKIFNFN
jgi:anhydro-N-acetylmuramic acid kinase